MLLHLADILLHVLQRYRELCCTMYFFAQSYCSFVYFVYFDMVRTMWSSFIFDFILFIPYLLHAFYI